MSNKAQSQPFGEDNETHERYGEETNSEFAFPEMPKLGKISAADRVRFAFLREYLILSLDMARCYLPR